MPTLQPEILRINPTNDKGDRGATAGKPVKGARLQKRAGVMRNSMGDSVGYDGILIADEELLEATMFHFENKTWKVLDVFDSLGMFFQHKVKVIGERAVLNDV